MKTRLMVFSLLFIFLSALSLFSEDSVNSIERVLLFLPNERSIELEISSLVSSGEELRISNIDAIQNTISERYQVDIREYELLMDNGSMMLILDVQPQRSMDMSLRSISTFDVVTTSLDNQRTAETVHVQQPELSLALYAELNPLDWLQRIELGFSYFDIPYVLEDLVESGEDRRYLTNLLLFRSFLSKEWIDVGFGLAGELSAGHKEPEELDYSLGLYGLLQTDFQADHRSLIFSLYSRMNTGFRTISNNSLLYFEDQHLFLQEDRWEVQAEFYGSFGDSPESIYLLPEDQSFILDLNLFYKGEFIDSNRRFALMGFGDPIPVPWFWRLNSVYSFPSVAEVLLFQFHPFIGVGMSMYQPDQIAELSLATGMQMKTNLLEEFHVEFIRLEGMVNFAPLLYGIAPMFSFQLEI